MSIDMTEYIIYYKQLYQDTATHHSQVSHYLKATIIILQVYTIFCDWREKRKNKYS